MKHWTALFRIPLAALALVAVAAAAVPGTSSAAPYVCYGPGNSCMIKIGDGYIVEQLKWVPVV